MANYPDDLDNFTRKQNAIPGMEDTTGDWVDAEHINDLQDVVISIEQTLGKTPQGSSLTVRDRIASLESSKALKTPSVCIFLGNPIIFNGAVSKAQAANEFLYYDHVVFGPNLENSANPDYNNFKELIAYIRASRDIKLYGYIDVGVITSNFNLTQIETKISAWDVLGVDGVFLYNFGYDFGVSRARQNDIINFLHSRELSAFVQSTHAVDTFGSAYNAQYNPDYTNSLIDKRDIYLHENIAVDTTSVNAYINSIEYAKSLITYRNNLGTKIFGVATIDHNQTQEVAQSYFDYAQSVAILCSYDAFYAVTEDYGINSNALKLYRNLSLVGNYYDKNPQISEVAGTYTRVGSFGKITVNTVNHSYTLEGISIPGENITGTINYATIVDSVIDAINANPDSIIDPEKIAPLLVSNIKDIVIQAINDSCNSGLTINDARIGDLNASHIVAGDIAAGRIQANIIQAINAYVQSLTVEQINAGVINANAISASVVDAINANIGSAVIDQAHIGDLNASHITAGDISADRIQTNVVDAINANLGTATIDGAVIRNATITSAQIASATITSANIALATITSAQIATAAIGTANIQDAAIINAHISNAAINTANIANGAITNAQIATATIMTSNIQNASITSALIADASITNAHVVSLDAGKITTGYLGAGRIEAGSITANMLAAGTITADSAIIGIAAITSANIADAAITSAHIADATITNANIANATITSANIALATITSANIANATITAANIQLATITNAQIADATITNANIAFSTITSANIADATITSAKIALATITNANIADATIGTAQIADAAITTAKVGTAQIDTANIKDAAITTAKIGTAQISTALIADASITNAKISDLSAEKINAGYINADRMKAGVIDAINARFGEAYIDGAVITNLDAAVITAGSISTDILKSTVIQAINATADTLFINSSKITSISADKLNVGFGGYNVLKNSDFFFNDVEGSCLNWTAIGTEPTRPSTYGFRWSRKCFYVNDVTAVTRGYEQTISNDYAGKTLALSAWVKWKNVVMGTTSSNKLLVELHYQYNNGVSDVDQFERISLVGSCTVESEFERVQKIMSLTPLAPNWTVNFIKVRVYLNECAGEFSATCVQLEEGDIATAWTRNPEEMNGAQNNVLITSEGIIITGGKLTVVDPTGTVTINNGNIAAETITTSMISTDGLNASVISAGTIDANSVSIATKAGGTGNRFFIDTNGLSVQDKDTIDGTTNMVRIDSSGLSISSDGGSIWTNKITGLGLSVTSAEIASLDAGKITTGTLSVTGSMSVSGGNVVLSSSGVTISGDSGIYVSGAGGIRIKEGTLKVDNNENITQVTIGQYTTGQYGIKAGSTTLDSSGITIGQGSIDIGSGVFTVTNTGILTATSATITGAVNATSGYFGGSVDGISVGSTGLDVVGSGTITSGTAVLSSSGLTITGSGASINLNSGKFIVASDGTLTATAGTVGGWTLSTDTLTSDNGLVTIKSSSTSNYIRTANALISPTKVVQLDSTGLTITGGAISVQTTDGSTAIDGNGINASTITTGTLTVGTGMSVSGGNVVLGSTGITVSGSSGITVTGIDGITISTGTLKVLNGTTPEVIVGQYTTGNFGIKAGNTILNSSGITMNQGSISINSGVFAVTSAGALTATSATVTGAINATSGYFGSSTNGITVNSTGLTVSGTGTIVSGKVIVKNDRIVVNNASDILQVTLGYNGTSYGIFAGTTKLDSTGLNMTQGSITLGTKFSVSTDGTLTASSATISGSISATSGTIGGLTVESTSVTFGNVTLNSSGIGVAGTSGIAVTGTGTIVAGYVTTYSDRIEVKNGTTAQAILGKYDTTNYGIKAVAGDIGGWIISSTDLKASNLVLDNTGKIRIGTNITLDGTTTTGTITATNVDLTGKITATSGSVGSWVVNTDLHSVNNVIRLNPTAETISVYNVDTAEVIFGKYDGLSYGLKAGNTILNSSGIAANQGTIGGLTIGDHHIQTNGFISGGTGFKISDNGLLEAGNVNLTGSVKATSGEFGVGSGRINASNDGIWAGPGVGVSGSVFWISSKPQFIGADGTTINPGDAYFKGSIVVEADSFISSGSDLVISEGSVIAGSRNSARVEMTYNEAAGGYISCWGYDSYSVLTEFFKVDRTGAKLYGDITATSGTILGNLSVGASSNVYLDGTSNAIYLYDNTDEYNDRVVRLNNLGLYISTDSGVTYDPALTGTGLNANVINDGQLTIADHGGGASGIVIKQWNETLNGYVDNVSINPGGIDVYNGAITVHSDKTGEVLIGGGYLRVKGLDMGVVTSNNYVGNGNFNMASDRYGLKQLNQDEVFLGRAQSSGGAVSNPTYHYAGWPDYPTRNPHTVYTYNVNPDGTLNLYDPENLSDPNWPNITRVSFNPQWSAVHPITGHCVIPNDADNFVTVINKDGNLVRNLKSWKGGLFGAAFTPAQSATSLLPNAPMGARLVVCGDDIDRKRAPWDMVVFDTSDSDPANWTRIGVIDVGEFPSKVICDDKGYAYVTISLDDNVYKIDIVNMRVVAIMMLTDVRGIPVIPQPIWISQDYSKIYVGGVVSDYVYEIPADFATPFASCRKFSILPYDGNRGIIHDLRTLPDGNICFSSASETDGYIAILNKDTGVMMTYIDKTMTDKLSAQTLAMEVGRQNFYGSTTLCPHPTQPIIYVTCTARCVVSVLSYQTGELIEIQRIEAGSNPSGVSISTDGTKLYVPNHHYHTYPLGANRIWGYNSSDNFYATDDTFDTTQKFYHYNPSGIIITDNRYVWIVNRATNDITIRDTNNWSNELVWEKIEDVGNKPFDIKINNAKTKVFVSNDDEDDQNTPDFITIIDVGTKLVEGHIHVADRPMGIEISSDDKYVYAACYDGKMVQKASVADHIVVNSAYLNGKPKYLKLVGSTLYATCSDTDELYVIDANTLDIIQIISCDEGPLQMVNVGSKLYVTNYSSDTVLIVNIATNTIEKRIDVGSGPRPIAYNPVYGFIYVGCSGEGTVAIINSTTDTVVDWAMTGHNPYHIAVSADGEKWYTSAHGPEGIYAYGEGNPFTGDAYLDNSGITHKYGAEYWMPTRSNWTRGADKTLTSFSSVEFWPSSKLQGKQGYAQLTVMGMYNAYARIEQDIYQFVNNSDGACEYYTELIELQQGIPLKLTEDVADFKDITGQEKRRIQLISATDVSIIYIEGVHYVVNYDVNEVSRLGDTIPASGKIENTVLVDTTAVTMIANGKNYNTITVYPLGQTAGEYIENTDYIIDRVNNTIARTVNSAIPSGNSVTVKYRHCLKVRYYYHPNKRNYSDSVVSADFFWKWPRPENQWVRMQLDELVPKFIYVDNDNIDPWRPIHDYGKPLYEDATPYWLKQDNTKLYQVPEVKGLVYSAYSDRVPVASITPSAIPISGETDNVKKTDGSTVVLPVGSQNLTIDLGAVYYANNITIDHGILVNNAKVEISEDNVAWVEVFNGLLAVGPSYQITFQKTYNSDYEGPKRVRYIRSTLDNTTNQWKQIKVMGDWKVGSYTFASNTIWDSESKRETFVTLGGTTAKRFDDPSITNIDPLNPTTRPSERVRYRLYYSGTDGSHDLRGEVSVYNAYENTLYKGVGYRNVTTHLPYAVLDTTGYDYVYDYMANILWRTADSTIADGEEVRIVYKFVQEDLSSLPLCIAHRNPNTGIADMDASVAESDVTGAWIQWTFTNDYRCDWYIGWIADIGLGNVNIYLDNNLTHSISQMSTKVERFSQISQDLLPGEHTIKLVQQQGRVNFDVIKLEDLQLLQMNSQIVASPSLNPVELFTWYTAKISPYKARKYLGRGTQVLSGAYDSLRVDKDLGIPNNQVPVRYRLRFQTTLEGRADAVDGEGGTGGEIGDRKWRFEQGAAMVTNVTMEKGVNPTYWRMAPAADKYTGFAIESWDSQEPKHTGIQTSHIANGAITADKIKAFSIIDEHIASNAKIQESKLSLNYATHPHEDLAALDKIMLSDGGILVDGKVKQQGQYEIVHRRPLYGIAGDLQFQTDSTTWETMVFAYGPFGYALPSVQTSANRYYRLYAIYSDDITNTDASATIAPRVRVELASDTILVYEWKMPHTYGAVNDQRDAYSSYFQVSGLTSGDHCNVKVRIQNDACNYAAGGKSVGIKYLELIAYDVF